MSSPGPHIPSLPPTEVHDAIDIAGLVWRELADRDRSLHFSLSSPGRVSVTLTDASGARLRSLTGSQSLAIAAGKPVG